jgi:nicotinate-nucleotide adenylyltransferase
MREINKLGILGGTFDPIHYGHLVAADCARDACHLDQVLFVISARPPHKALDKVLDCQHRYEMVQIAVQNNPAFEVSAMELERQGLSYTVETIAAYLRQFPGVEIYFIMGVDALQIMNTWKDVDRLSKLCKFIVVTRPGYQLRREDECFQGLPATLWEKIIVIPIPGLFISSSEIKQRVAQGKTIKYLLPPGVEQYIWENNLYKDGDEPDA